MEQALVIVDMQNDFVHPDGSLALPGGESIIPRVNELIEQFPTVVYTRDYHPPRTTHFVEGGGPWPAHCVAGTWGAEYHRELLQRVAPEVKKGMGEGEDGYSGFYAETEDGEQVPTSLDSILQAHGIEEVTVVGVALDVCVRATALDSVALGYDTVLVRNATVPVTSAGGATALDELFDRGVRIL